MVFISQYYRTARSFFFLTLFSLLFFFSDIAHARNSVVTDERDPAVSDDRSVAADSSDPNALFNPLGTKSIQDIFQAILDIIMVFAIPIILFFIVWAGFLYVTAGGNQDQISKATKALTYAVIGGVIVLGANVLLAVITNTISIFAT